MKAVNLEDSYQINLIVGFLFNFPEIFTINYDFDHLSYCFTFMIRGKITLKQFRRLCNEMKEIWDSYCYFLKQEPIEIKMKKEYYSGLTKLNIFFTTDTLNSKEVSLVNCVIKDMFKENLVGDYRTDKLSRFDNDSQVRDEHQEFLFIQGEQKEKTLFAFRESGKVYVLN